MRKLVFHSILLLPVLALATACHRVDRSESPAGGSSSADLAPTIITTESGVEMVLIPAGRFRMGSDDGPADQCRPMMSRSTIF